MKDALRVVYRSMYEAYLDLGFIVWASLLWLVGVLPVVTSGPVTAGLFYIIKAKKKGESVTPKDFWQGIRRFGKTSLVLTVMYLFVSIPAMFYVSVLLSLQPLWLNVLGFMLLYLLIIWHVLYLFMFPLMVEQGVLHVRVLLKRSIRLFTENLSFSFNVTLYVIMITAVSMLFPLLALVWAGWMALIAYNAFLFLMQKYDPERYELDLNVSWKGSWSQWKE